MEDIFKSGADVGVFSEDFLEQIKNLLIVKSSPNAKDFLDLPESELQILKEISEQISEGHIHLLFDMMLEITQNLMRTQDQRTVLEVGLLKLCLYPRIMDTQPLSGKSNSAMSANNQSSAQTTAQISRAFAKPTASKPASNTAASNSGSSVPLTMKSPILQRPNPSTQSAAQTVTQSVVQPVSQVKPSATDKTAIPNAAKPTPNAAAGFINQGAGTSTAVQSTANPNAKPKAEMSYIEEQEEGFGLSEDQQKWHDFVSKVNRLNAKMGAVLQNCIYDLKGSSVWVGASEKMVFIKKDLAKPEFQKILTNYIKTFLGPDFILKLDHGSLTEGQQIQPEKTAIKEQEDMTAEEKRRLIEKIHNSEAVQKLKETFKDIEIVAIKEMKS
jgi:DNA polymerase III gamma/tau subunit